MWRRDRRNKITLHSEMLQLVTRLKWGDKQLTLQERVRDSIQTLQIYCNTQKLLFSSPQTFDNKGRGII